MSYHIAKKECRRAQSTKQYPHIPCAGVSVGPGHDLERDGPAAIIKLPRMCVLLGVVLFRKIDQGGHCRATMSVAFALENR